MSRLSLQIYLTALAILVLFAMLAATTFVVTGRGLHDRDVQLELGRLAGELLPGSEAPPAEVEAELSRLVAPFGVDAAVYDAAGSEIARVGEDFEVSPEDRGWRPWRHPGPTAALRLPDGRRIVLRRPHRADGSGLLVLAVFAVACAVGAYPLVRRLTGRLERLQRRVEALGEGDLSARVEVEGRDEVARLAERFNQAAARIERLVDAQRHLLASASHELRSPLARLRMAVELLGSEPGSDVETGRRRIRREIRVLDDLIDELLLASRLQTVAELDVREPVDLLALAAEVAADFGLEVEGACAEVEGDPRLLRRLVRNLLENARRHADEADVRVEVRPRGEAGFDGAGGGARLLVEDTGPGVPEHEREAVFEPFHRLSGRSEAEGGVGLGLALVRRIARHHGGDVRCGEGAEGGARFEVELPARR